MARSKIQQIFDHSWEEYLQTFPASSEQVHAGYSIIHCKTKEMGYNVSTCSECGYKQIHNNSCRKRNCPNCQAFLKEIWIDARKSEVIDTPYFHTIFTVPAELRPIIFFFFFTHIHSSISGGGLTKDLKLRKSTSDFFIPIEVLQTKFRKKFLILLDKLYSDDKLYLPESCNKLKNRFEWNDFRRRLYDMEMERSYQRNFQWLRKRNRISWAIHSSDCDHKLSDH